ncbi:sarcosine oxidase subunit gamma [Aestuariibius sp. 2305UL40-4]|uniref:sarcosine oxidase subunit gamma n=1 Tax=Aestuariibius violaceus TaxID=3234132 RepID=UPI00345EDCAB
MVSLVASDPFGGALPWREAGVSAEAVAPGPVTWIAPFDGQEAAVGTALGAQLPEAGRAVAVADGRILWFGRGQWLVIGAPLEVDLEGLAAVADQSDGWVACRVGGASHVELLARLVPVDLRVSAFPVGAVARTIVKHTSGLIARVAEDAVEVWVMRSFARTLAGDLREAADGLSLRRG